jgi:hypothetical protein
MMDFLLDEMRCDIREVASLSHVRVPDGRSGGKMKSRFPSALALRMILALTYQFDKIQKRRSDFSSLRRCYD